MNNLARKKKPAQDACMPKMLRPNLVGAIKLDRFDREPGGVIFKELRALLSLHFVMLSYSHIRRTCNSYVHQFGFQRDPDQPAT